MGYSNVVFSTIAMSDIVPPGVPDLVVMRVGNREIEARVTLPTTDIDGEPLSGMTELIIAVMEEQTVGINPLGGIAPDLIATTAEASGGQSATIFVGQGDAGALKATRFNGLSVGSIYWIGATVKDVSE